MAKGYGNGGAHVTPDEETTNPRGVGRSVPVAAVDGRNQPGSSPPEARSPESLPHPAESLGLPAKDLFQPEVDLWQEEVCSSCGFFARVHPTLGRTCPTCESRIQAHISVGEADEWAELFGMAGIALLFALRSYANREGTCWPSVQTLSNRSRVSQRSIWRILKAAIDLGLLEKTPSPQTKRPNGRPANGYRLR